VPSKVNSSAPREFDLWFQKCCARLTTHRFASAREAAVALQNLDQWVASQREQSSFEVRPIQPSVLELELAPGTTSKRTKVLAGFLAAAAVAIGGVGLYTAHLANQTNLMMSEPLPSADATPTATASSGNEDAGAVGEADAGSEAAAAPSASTSAVAPRR
jgi:hypothetical protein